MAVVKPAMELASVQAAVVSEAGLKAYDELLAGASRLTLRLAKSNKAKAFKTFRVDVDGRRDQLTILVNFDGHASTAKSAVHQTPFGLPQIVIGSDRLSR
jgi:hypothetical protein